jgi:hypothetical protein
MMFKATVNPGRNDRFGAMRYDPEFLKECLRITQQIPVILINQHNRIHYMFSPNKISLNNQMCKMNVLT